jgi:hypothetical protein
MRVVQGYERRDAATKSGLKNTAMATNAAVQSIPLTEPTAVRNSQQPRKLDDVRNHLKHRFPLRRPQHLKTP